METTQEDPVRRPFRVGVHGNGALALVGIGIGWIAGSRSLAACGAHALANLALAGGAWLARRFADRQDGRGFGRGKIDALSGLLAGAGVLGAGLAIFAFAWISNAQPVDGWLSGLALGTELCWILANLAAAWSVRNTARSLESEGLAHLARGQVSAALAGAAAVLAWLGLRSGFKLSDAFGASIVGALVAWRGWRTSRAGFDVLVDRSDPALQRQVTDTARRIEGVRGVQDVDVYPLGRRFEVDVEVTVDPELTVERADRIARTVEEAIVREHEAVRTSHVRASAVPGNPPAAG